MRYCIFMTIREFLEENEISSRKFAKALGVHPVTVRKWLCGTHRPLPNVSMKIVEMSFGKITLDDIYMASEK